MLHTIINFNIQSPEILELISLKVPNTMLRVNSVFDIPMPRTNVMILSPLFQMLQNHRSIENSLDIFQCTVSDIKNFPFK